MLAIIVPCYNEANRLNAEEFISFSEKNPDFHFYFANDGSSDQTSTFVRSRLVDDRNRFLIDFTENQGKAAVIRKAVLHVMQNNDKNYSHYGFIDADLAIPLEQLNRLVQESEKQMSGRMFVTVRTEKEFAQSSRIRYYVSKVWKFLFVRLFFGLGISDSQCGCKLIDARVADKAFREEFISRWLFDIEIVFRLLASNKDAVKEVPIIHLNDNSGSTISNFAIVKLFNDAFKIYARYKIGKRD